MSGNFDTFNGSITTATSSATFDTVADTGAYVQFFGTYAGVTANFEGTIDGGTNWLPIGGYLINGNNASSSIVNNVALATNSTAQYYLMIGACKQVRIRASAWTSGTANYGVMITTDADPILPGNGSSGSAVSNFPAAAAGTDASATPTTTSVYADGKLYNGATWDFSRGNVQAAVDTSTARTVTGTGATTINYNATGAKFWLNVTAASGTTPTLVWKIQWSPDGGTTWVDLDASNLSTASITTTGTAVLTVYPGLTTAANSVANNILPRHWRSAWTIGGTTPSFTFASYVQYVVQ